MAGRAAKAKGRALQNFVRDRLRSIFSTVVPSVDIKEDDIKSQTMGMTGEDIILTPFAREFHPYSYECKNVERLNIWEAIDQCQKNRPDCTAGIVVIKKNRKKPHVVMSWETYQELIEDQLLTMMREVHRF